MIEGRRVTDNVSRPDTSDSFAKDKAAVVKYAPQYSDQVYAITVGSESLYRGNFTGDELLEKIKDVKTALNGKFKVGTADSWNKYADGTADPVIKGGVDILLCNGFSYWQGQELKNATHSFFDDVMQAFGHIQDVTGSASKGPELWVGETGMINIAPLTSIMIHMLTLSFPNRLANSRFNLSIRCPRYLISTNFLERSNLWYIGLGCQCILI